MVIAPEAAAVATGTLEALKLETTPLLGHMKEAAHERLKATMDGGDNNTAAVTHPHDAVANGTHGLSVGPRSASDSDDGIDAGHANGHQYASTGLPASVPTPLPTGRKAIPCRFHHEKRCLHGEAGDGCPFSHTIPWQPQADPTYRGGHSRGPSLPNFGHVPINPTAYGGGVQSGPGQPPYYTPQQASVEWGYNPQGYGAAPAPASGASQPSHAVGPSQPTPTAPFHDYRYGPGGFPHPPYVPGYGYPYYIPPPAMYGGIHPPSGGVALNQGQYPPSAAPVYPAEYSNMVSPSLATPAQMITSDYSESAVVPSTEGAVGVAISAENGEAGVDVHQSGAGIAAATDGTSNGIHPQPEHVTVLPHSYYQPGPPLPPSPPAYGPPSQHRGLGPFPKSRGMNSGRGRSTNGRSRFSTHDGILSLGEGDDRPPRGPCSFFAQGVCCFGDKCSFGHVMPNGDDARDYRLDYHGVDGPEGSTGVMRHGRLPKSDAFVPQSVPGYTVWRERQKQKEKQNKGTTGHSSMSKSAPQLSVDTRNRSESAEVRSENRHKWDDVVQQRRDGGFSSRRSHLSHSHGQGNNHMKALGNSRPPATQLPEQRVPSGDDFPALVTSSNSPTQLGASYRSDVGISTLFPKAVDGEKESQIASPSTTCEATTIESLANSIISASHHDDSTLGAGMTAGPAEHSAAIPIHQARLVGSFASAAARALSAPPTRTGSAANTATPSPRAVTEIS